VEVETKMETKGGTCTVPLSLQLRAGIRGTLIDGPSPLG